MKRIQTIICGSLSLTLLAASPAPASVIEIIEQGGTFADLRESLVEYVRCVKDDPRSTQQCLKVLWDPPVYLREGVLSVDIEPINGDISRVGNVQSITFFNGYTGAGPFRRIDGVDTVRFEIPVVSVEPPDEELKNVDIVELLVADTGVGENRLSFTFGGEDVLVDKGDGQPPAPAEVIGKTEFLGYNVPLTTGQEVPPPEIPGGTTVLPLGSAVVNVDPAAGDIRIQGEYQGMTSDVIAAHLHGPAPMGEVAPPLFALEVSPLEPTEEEGIHGVFTGESMLSSESIGDLFAGLTYINVHTELNPAGEIRGQILPEPSAMSLLIVGLTVVAGCRRTNRSAGCRSRS